MASCTLDPRIRPSAFVDGRLRLEQEGRSGTFYRGLGILQEQRITNVHHARQFPVIAEHQDTHVPRLQRSGPGVGHACRRRHMRRRHVRA